MAVQLIRFVRTRDLALVRALVTAPGSWDAATDDSSPHSNEWQPLDDERVWYVVALGGECPPAIWGPGDVIALYTLISQNAICFEIHATRVFGRNAGEALKGVLAWAFAQTPARRIVASIPATNRAAIRAAERAGMTRYGINTRSLLKRGQLVDQVLAGISPA